MTTIVSRQEQNHTGDFKLKESADRKTAVKEWLDEMEKLKKENRETERLTGEDMTARVNV